MSEEIEIINLPLANQSNVTTELIFNNYITLIIEFFIDYGHSIFIKAPSG